MPYTNSYNVATDPRLPSIDFSMLMDYASLLVSTMYLRLWQQDLK